jgi:hypothetical protein
VEDIQIRSTVGEDGALHFGVRGVDDSITEGFGLALQLKRRLAFGTEIIHGGSVSRSDIETRGFADWAEEVEGAPSFSADTGAL